MSSKGKNGEMCAIKLIADICVSEDADFTRPTTTNTADMGADLVLEHPENYLPKMEQIASGESISECSQSMNNPVPKPATLKSRIDIKTTDKKISTDTVKKFVGDVRKHPDCEGHILMGGKSMTGPAEKEWSQAQETFNDKELIYIDNKGFDRLTEHYQNNQNKLSGNTQE